MSGYVIAGYLVTVFAIGSYVAWILVRARSLRKSLVVDVRTRVSDSSS